MKIMKGRICAAAGSSAKGSPGFLFLGASTAEIRTTLNIQLKANPMGSSSHTLGKRRSVLNSQM